MEGRKRPGLTSKPSAGLSDLILPTGSGENDSDEGWGNSIEIMLDLQLRVRQADVLDFQLRVGQGATEDDGMPVPEREHAAISRKFPFCISPGDLDDFLIHFRESSSCRLPVDTGGKFQCSLDRHPASGSRDRCL